MFVSPMNGAHLVAMHRNKYWQTAQGLRMDIGAFVAGLEYVSGRKAVVVGKPSADFFRLATKSLGLPTENIAMVGDDIETDVGGGQVAGLKGILVKTGKYRAETAAQSKVRPEITLNSIADLPHELGL